MVDVVDRGTARIAKIKGINVAGKTGTVENFILIEDEKKQLTDHSTFIAFAPALDASSTNFNALSKPEWVGPASKVIKHGFPSPNRYSPS